MRLLLVTLASAAGVVVLMTLTVLLARRLGRISVIDVIWGLGFVLVALVSAVLGDGSLGIRLLMLGLVGAWGLRLAIHIGRRARGKGEDPRYEALLAEGKGGIVRRVLVPQGVAIWFVSLPVQVSSVSTGHLPWLVAVGCVVWLVGLAFETIGDAQLSAYRRDPDRGPVMDRGLWGWTRHPNYFGDATLWWGLYLVAAAAWPGPLTLLSPVAMSYFLVFATGARLLEKTMMQRPGYPEYAARTSMFFPRPPKGRRAA